jgi:hypothetical protein
MNGWSYTYTLLPLYAFMAWTGKTLPYTRYIGALLGIRAILYSL